MYNNSVEKNNINKEMFVFLKEKDPRLELLFQNSYGINYIFDYIDDDLNILHLTAIRDDVNLMKELLSFNMELTKLRTFTENTPFLMFSIENASETYVTELLNVLSKNKKLLNELILEVNMYNENIFDYLQQNELEYDFIDLKKTLINFIEEISQKSQN
jgi:hypothetical protein